MKNSKKVIKKNSSPKKSVGSFLKGFFKKRNKKDKVVVAKKIVVKTKAKVAKITVKKITPKGKNKVKKNVKKVSIKKTPKKPAVKVLKKVSKKQLIPAVPTQIPEEFPKRIEHVSVLVDEVLEGLQPQGKKHFIDGTLGLGGHSKHLLEKAGPQAKLFAFEVDEDNLQEAKARLKDFGERVVYIKNNFEQMAEELAKLKVKGVDAILLDLGLSSPQVDNAEKGFSFLREGPLDMRFDKSKELTAAEVINNYSEKELIRIFKDYGEEFQARKIVKEILARRRTRKFKMTTELANFIEKIIKRQGHIHPATRVFQALRIEVNKELNVLQNVLMQAAGVLKQGGRIAVISYHSLEDRIVKQFFKDNALTYVNEPDKLETTKLEPKFSIVTKKPVVPSAQEIAKNPRSRSAKLRIAQKL